MHIRLKRIREKRGITPLQMAKAIGVPVSTYREWEYGRAIRGEPYLRIAEVLNVSLYELFTGLTPASADEKIFQIECLLKEIRLLLK